MRLPPLFSLRAFEAAVRTGGFARAAIELALTPNAVAHQVKQLEAWLDVRLFDRHPRGVLPTAAGRDYALAIGELFAQLETATRALKSRHDDRVVTVTAIPSFVSRWLMPRLTTLAERHPEVEVRVLASVQPVDLARGEADVAIRLGQGPYPGLSAEVLIDEDFVAVASAAFLAGKPPLREPAELVERRVPLLHDEIIPEIAAQIDWPRWLRAVGVTPPRRLAGHLFSHTYLTLEAAMAGQGVAIASHATLGDAVRSGLLTVLFDGLSVRGPYRYHLLTRPGAEQRPAVAAVCAWLREEAGREPVVLRLPSGR
ncbi:LysR substrate-binding domain-containing protein [Crenobacter cavernae]|uniref:LysR family transcriptional regulator n=1 Tax=Crenobacter cavernae TaxID=2290923 RepID=A0ABY0FEW2_9NEIS|nr:LysR substrate-binding domain-containing protein [Crenobacter cavernae]RXZ43433.1 LysR family transcriptional regulator [Crenobacter cavernae]